MKDTPTPPPAPDPNVVAGAQTASNQATAQFQSQLNNGNTVGPAGSITNVQNPNTNQWTQTTQLSPAEQGLFNSGTQAQQGALDVANQQIGRVGQALQTPLTPPSLQGSVGNAGQIATGFDPGSPLQTSFNPGQQVQGQVGSQNINQSVMQAELGSYNNAQMFLQPQQAQAAEQQQAALVAQGLNPNDTAYQNSQNLFQLGQTQQQQSAINNAIAAGQTEQNTLFGQQVQQGNFANSAAGQEYAQNQGSAAFNNAAAGQQYGQNQGQAAFQNTAQQQQYGQDLSSAQFANQTAQQNFQNQAYAQQQPINEFTALMGNGQVQMPGGYNGSQTSVAPTDVTGAYALQQQQLNSNYQSQMANYQSGLSGLFSLGSAGMMAFSDVRLKRDILKLWTRPDGINVYRFRYVGAPQWQVGVMAQEVQKIRPDAVNDDHGILSVDYGRLAA